MLTKADRILIVLVVLLSLSIFLVTGLRPRDPGLKKALVKVAGKTYREIELTEEAIGEKILIETEYGSNLIEVGRGSLRVIEASCPDKLDVKQGSISKATDMIVCLPNKMTIEIVGGDSGDEIDYLAR